MYNKMKAENSKLKARIGQLTREVTERDKLMQKFILGSESDVKVKESCVLQSYKSKLASVERKHHKLKKQVATLQAQNTELRKSDEATQGKLAQLQAEKDMLHSECVKMSQHIYIAQHERRRKMWTVA